MSSRLLIHEPPLQVLPSLAKRIGLNEALVLQQIHYLAGRSGDGWVRRSLEDWHRVFGFWSLRTLQSVITNLRKTGLLLAESDSGVDRTLRYRIDYEHETIRQDLPDASSNIGTISRAGETSGSSTTSVRGATEGKKDAAEPLGFDDWLEHHCTVTGSRQMSRTGTRARATVAKSFAKAVGDGYTVEQLKHVSEAVWSDDWRRSGGHTSPESVLVPKTIERFLERPAGAAAATEHQTQVEASLQLVPALSGEDLDRELARVKGEAA